MLRLSVLTGIRTSSTLDPVSSAVTTGPPRHLGPLKGTWDEGVKPACECRTCASVSMYMYAIEVLFRFEFEILKA